MNNLTHHFSTCYTSNLECRELNLVRDLDEDTRIFSFYFSSSPLGQTVDSGNSPFISDPWNHIHTCVVYAFGHKNDSLDHLVGIVKSIGCLESYSCHI